MHLLNSIAIICKCIIVLYIADIVNKMCVHMLTEHVPGMGYCEDLTDNCDYVDIAEKPIPTNKQLSILQLNIRGVLGKQSLLTNLLKDTNKHSKAQIILLQETWLKKGTEKTQNPWLYLHWFPQEKQKRRWGWYSGAKQTITQGKKGPNIRYSRF